MAAAGAGGPRRVVLPGEAVGELPVTTPHTVAAGAAAAGEGAAVARLGPGTRERGGAVWATQAGVLRREERGPRRRTWRVEGSRKRYSAPGVGDLVVGVVTAATAEQFLVDLGGPFPAALPALAFAGATKRNRPNLRAGDVVYARVAATPRDLDPVLTCVDEATGKAQGFGPLRGGTVVRCGSGLARRLLAWPPAPVLAALGEKIAFETAVGVNGRVWIDSPTPTETILVAAALRRAEQLPADAADDPEAAAALVAELLATVDLAAERDVNAAVEQLMTDGADAEAAA